MPKKNPEAANPSPAEPALAGSAEEAVKAADSAPEAEKSKRSSAEETAQQRAVIAQQRRGFEPYENSYFGADGSEVEHAGDPDTCTVVVPEYDRAHRQGKPGETRRMWGFEFTLMANGDAMAVLPPSAAAEFCNSGRSINALDHAPRPAASAEEVAAANRSEAVLEV